MVTRARQAICQHAKNKDTTRNYYASSDDAVPAHDLIYPDPRGKNFPDVEMVSVTVDNPRHRQNYKTFAKRCASSLRCSLLGAEFGDRIGTLAWNDYRHMELYYGISGSGMVCHTINPKLFPEQVAYIINHAEDKILFADVLVMPLLEALKAHLGKVEPSW